MFSRHGFIPPKAAWTESQTVTVGPSIVNKAFLGLADGYKQTHPLAPRLFAMILGEAAKFNPKSVTVICQRFLRKKLKKGAQAFIRTMGCRGAKEKGLGNAPTTIVNSRLVGCYGGQPLHQAAWLAHILFIQFAISTKSLDFAFPFHLHLELYLLLRHLMSYMN